MAQFYDPRRDPAFVSYLASVGVQQSEIQRQLQERIKSIQRTQQRRDIIAQSDFGRIGRDVDTNFEDRGLFRSGTRLAERDRLITRRQTEETLAQDELKDDILSATGTSQAQLAGLEVEKQAKGLATSQNLALTEAARTIR